MRSRDEAEIGSSCDDNSPFRSLTIPLVLYSDPDSHSLDNEDFILSFELVVIIFLRSASLTLMLRRLRATEVGALPLIVRSGDEARAEGPTRSVRILVLTSSRPLSVVVSGPFFDGFCIGGRGFPVLRVPGWLLNISVTGDAFGERCSRGIGGTGGGVSSD